MKLRNSKHQPPTSKEAPSPKLQTGSASFKGWNLKFPWMLDVDAWNFCRRGASTLIIVLWISFGLVSITLYFAHSMSMELRASDYRVSALGAEQAIEGAARYVSYLLADRIADGSNGIPLDPSAYVSEAVQVGDSRFWLIGRETNTSFGGGQIAFGLVDEASKLNLNAASSNMLGALLDSMPRSNPDLASAILDWRNTNSSGAYQTYYATRPQPYVGKSAPFETVDELRLLYGGDFASLVGEDLNRNGILDPNETDENHNGQLDPGILECVTVYSREPNTRTNGETRISIRLVGSTGPVPSLLESALGATRAQQILLTLGLLRTGPAGPGGPNQSFNPPPIQFTSPLQFYYRTKMTTDEFSKIADDITLTNGAFMEGRVNVNSASATVLACLPGLSSNPELAQTLVSYRQSNPDKLATVAWIVDALGSNNVSVLQALWASDCITTHSYQFSADVAAIGPNRRGYHRTRFVFDTSEGTPKILYRQDLTHLGWALGKEIRQDVLLANKTR